MFHVLSNVQSGEANRLLSPIDNREGRKVVALRSVQYWVGWYNVKTNEYVRWTRERRTRESVVAPGLYSFQQLEHKIRVSGVRMDVDPKTGKAAVTVPTDTQVSLSEGLTVLLGLENRSSLTTGIGVKPVNFSVTGVYVHLDQVSTSNNFVNGRPSTLIGVVSVPDRPFGSLFATSVIPEYRKLQADVIGELTVSLRDACGRIIENNGLPVSVTLEIQDEYIRTQ